ncbi:MAG: hypothetical protein ACK5IQ_09635 [Bacteroidales bacterium]
MSYNRKYICTFHDTLEEVATRFGYKKYDLQDYHNAHCALDKRIVSDVGSGVEIILPPEGFTLKEGGKIDINELKLVQSGMDGTIYFKPYNLDRTYGVVIKRSEGDKTTQLHYKIHFRFVRMTKNDTFEIEIEKQQVYINNQAPDLIAEQLAEECGSVLYPLRLEIARSAKILSITNVDKIEERWKNRRNKILKYYNSYITKRIVAEMDTACKSHQKLLQSIKNNLFFSLYFSNLYIAHGEDFVANYNRDIPLDQFEAPFDYSITQSLLPYQTKSNKVKLVAGGSYADTNTKSQFLSIYKLSPVSNTIFSIEGTFLLEQKKQIKETVFNTYHLEYLEKQIQ